GGEPWYLITNQSLQTPEEVWEMIFIYAKRWKIEMSFRYEKSELLLESVRVQAQETREKLLWMVTLVYAFLLSLLDDEYELLRRWLFRQYCHRTGNKYRQ